MKKIFYMVLAGAMVALMGCSKERAEGSDPDSSQTLFTLSPATRATLPPANSTRYVMEAYNEDGTTPANVFENGTNHAETTTGNSFVATLDKTKAYTCLFWADDAVEVHSPVCTYDASNLKAITLHAGKPVTEAYFGKVQIEKGRTPAVTVTLQRAVAKITLTETAGVDTKKTLTAAYKQYTSFNVLEGEASGDLQSGSFSAITTTGEVPYKLATLYVLSKPEKELVDFTLTYHDEPSKLVTTVPVQMNYVTNINGEYSSLVYATFTISAEGEWNGDLGIKLDAIDVDYTSKQLSNSYILNSDVQRSIIYKIPVRRVNDFWGQAAYNTQALTDNQIGATDVWSVALLWQDVNGMVTVADEASILLTKTTGKGANDYFEVMVPKGYSGKGNFVIALAKGTTTPITNGKIAGPAIGDGAILWSWHFWVTDYNPYPESNPAATNPESYLYQLPLGNGALNRLINGRAGGGNKTIWTGEYATKFMLDRNVGALSTEYSAAAGVLHYQYGRKDPFPAVATLYDINGATVNYSADANAVSGSKTMAYAVNNPLHFIYKSMGSWSSDLNYTSYLWNDPNVVLASTAKSIFDPSPMGFKLPKDGIWSGLTTSTFKFSSTTKLGTISGTVVYPAAGTRSASSGSFTRIGTYGYYWSCSPSDAKYGTCFYFTPTLKISSDSYRPTGNSIRSVQE